MKSRKSLSPLVEIERRALAEDVAARLGGLTARLGTPGPDRREKNKRRSRLLSGASRTDAFRRGARATGRPVGSGAMEIDAQTQNRFKRPGQFWSDRRDQRRLVELDLVHRRAYWDQIWRLAASLE